MRGRRKLIWVTALRLFRVDSGNVAVEFAIIGPILFIFLFGTAQLALVLFAGSTVQWAIEEVSRTAMIDSSTTGAQIQTMVNDKLAKFGKDLQVTVNYSVDNSGAVPLGHVTATYSSAIVVPFLSIFNTAFKVDTYLPQPVP